MKKILGIIVVGLLLSGCETMTTQQVLSDGKIKTGMSKTQLKEAYSTTGESNDPFLNGCFKEYNSNSKMEIISSKDRDVWFVFEKVNWPMSKCTFKTMGDGVLYKWFPTYSEAKSETSGDLTFTIKDKKDQCEAIGFFPATEKFADCVLRLVELDIKSQQADQIALAQSQGNQQVVTQLQNQRNDQSSQAFIDLGLKLLSPQSTVSAPSTTNCRVIGSGAYKTVNCW
ncbi:hypothetical protein OAL65_02695 [Candidatus Pelagibacter sp.]|nr:hypothetical protein [Candidatus Pelagibacter sp.]